MTRFHQIGSSFSLANINCHWYNVLKTVRALFPLQYSKTLLFSFRAYFGFFYFHIYRLSEHVSVFFRVISFSTKRFFCLFSLASNFASSFRVFLTIRAVRLFFHTAFLCAYSICPFRGFWLLPTFERVVLLMSPNIYPRRSYFRCAPNDLPWANRFRNANSLRFSQFCNS